MVALLASVAGCTSGTDEPGRRRSGCDGGPRGRGAERRRHCKSGSGDPGSRDEVTEPTAASTTPAGTAGASSSAPGTQVTPAPVPFSITSTAFTNGDPIPAVYTCRGRDVSPDMAWRGIPGGTSALVLLVDDPDAGYWVHWSVLDLAGSNGGLARGIAPTTNPPQQGTNSFSRVGYGGPCPPSGTHHYLFTLYALAAPLGLPGHPDGGTVRAALQGAQVLATTSLTGTFTH